MKKLPLALCIASISPILFAESNPKLEEVIVVSTRTETPAITQGTSFSVINEQQLIDQSFESLADHLATQVGVDVRHSGGLGSVTSVFIRGEESFRTQLRVDGLKLVDVTSPQVAPIFDSTLLNGSNRIEILRGPQGAIYGADAGGVISVTTKNYQQGTEGEIDLRGGSDEFRRFYVAIGHGGDWGQFAILASGLRTDGFNAQEIDTDADRDGNKNQTIHVKAEQQLSEELSVKLILRNLDSEVEYDRCFNSDFLITHACLSDSNLFAGLLSAQFNTESLSQSIAISRTISDREDESDGLPSFSLKGEVERVEYLGEFRIAESFNLSYGLDYENETVSGEERHQNGVFVSVAGVFSADINYNLVLRHDDNDGFGSFNTYRLSTNVPVLTTRGGQLRIKGSHGTGFRAPSLSEQLYNDGPFAFGAADDLQLTEENSRGYDVGLQWFGESGLFASLVYFNQKIEDEIQFAGDFSGYLQFDGDSESTGIEAELEWVINNIISFQVNYTFNETEDLNGDQRARRPEQIANFGLTLQPLEGLRLYGNVRVVQDAVEITGEQLEDYEIVNTTARYSFGNNKSNSIYITVDNLFDQDYQEVIGFNTPGRMMTLGTNISF